VEKLGYTSSIAESPPSLVFPAPIPGTGTGPEVFGNCNAPPAVTYSAAIYCLRCLVGADIPLNQVRRRQVTALSIIS
jgi:hypothetical protein